MRIFSRTTKVLGVSPHELATLQDLIQQAKTDGKAEKQISDNEYFAIEVSDMYARRPRNHQETKS